MAEKMSELEREVAGIPLFAPLAADQRSELARLLRRKHYRRGAVVVHSGDELTLFLYLMMRGAVKATRTLANGEEAVVGVLGPGDFFGELSLLDGQPRSASIITVEPCEMLLLERTAFQRFVLANPAAALVIMAVLSQRIRLLNSRIESRFLDIDRRLARELLDLGRQRGKRGSDGLGIATGLSQAELANLIGASRPRVNRTLCKWQDEGLIKLGGRGEVTLVKVAELEALAESVPG